MIPVLVDCDPGQDDAIALLLALASPELELLGVTTVAGNQTLAKVTDNAIRVLELAGRGDVPVAAGADRPLARELVTAADAHGETGLDGPELPPARGQPVDRHAGRLPGGAGPLRGRPSRSWRSARSRTWRSSSRSGRTPPGSSTGSCSWEAPSPRGT